MTVTDDGSPPLSATQAGIVVFQPQVTKLVVSGVPTPSLVGAPSNLTVQVTDE